MKQGPQHLWVNLISRYDLFFVSMNSTSDLIGEPVDTLANYLKKTNK